MGDDIRNFRNLRDLIGQEALPIMAHALCELVKILEREMGGPISNEGLIALGIRLDFVANGGVLMTALPEGAEVPEGMMRHK